MRLLIVWAVTVVLSGPLYGTPPVSGVILTGSDSSLHVFWYHPQLHAYEQGIDRGAPELNLVPTDIPGQYSIVQKLSFPYLAFISQYLIKVNPGDIYPGMPGDQFSPFGYSVYSCGADSLPIQPAAATGTNRLCGGIPCDSQWVINEVGLLNIDGGGLWFGMDWADSTPTKPQIKCVVQDEEGLRNLVGIMSGGQYTWADIMYCPIYRNRFLSPFQVDTTVLCGWRRPILSEILPDSFWISCYRSGEIRPLSQYVCGNDSLYLRLPFTDIDSIEVSACYNNRQEDSSLVLAFDHDRVMPIGASVEYKKGTAPIEFDLIVNNYSTEELELVLGYDRHLLKSRESGMRLDGSGTAVIQFQAKAFPLDSLEAMVVFRDRLRRYHPYLAVILYPPQSHTDVDDQNPDKLAGPFRAYPNPCRERLVISAESPIRDVEVKIYNVTGQLVGQLNSLKGGDLVWEARDRRGERLPAGIYFVRVSGLKAGAETRKIVLLK